MRRDAPRIGIEVVLVALVLATLAGALGLVVQAQKRGARPVASPPIAVVAPAPEPPRPEPPPPPEPSPVDLTPGRLAAIAAQVAERTAKADAAARRAEAAETAANDAAIESDTWDARARALRVEIADRDEEAGRAAAETDALARERDALIAERDETRADLERQKLRARDGVAVLPYKGPNGTWRRPIAIECKGDAATLRPRGPSYSMVDLAGFGDPRTNPLVLAVARAMIRVGSVATPDGAASVPYLVFVVRPDGIRPFYAARTLLEPLGIAYGYELVDADWDIEFPDLDDPAEWSDKARPRKSPSWPPPPTVAEAIGRRSGGSGEGRAGGLGAGAMGDPEGRALASEGAGEGGARPVGAGGTRGGLGLNEGGGVGRGGRANGLSGSDVAALEDAPDPSRAINAYPPGNGRGDSPIAPRGMGEGTGPLPGGRPGTNPSSVASRDEGDGPGGRSPFGTGDHVADGPMGEGPVATPGDRPGTLANGVKPGQVGSPEGLPAFEPAPPSGSGGGQPGSFGGSPPARGDRTLSDRIAQREGLVAPTLPAIPNRSGGGTASRSASPSSSGTPGGSGSEGGSASPSSGGSSGGGGGEPGGSGGGSGLGGWSHSARSLPITVACDRNGATIHPGNVTVPLDTLTRDDSAFPAKLRALVAANQAAEPEVGFRPRVTFVVKPGGEDTYLKARWQAATGTNYPQGLRVVESGAPRLPGLDRR